ncbi:MAG: DMT family transporter [Paracoccaceae bacterium]|nr:DMT family transporter [Paracoccaceae bacterium]|tara:strand:- start:29 stop:937 length:909 start_codon:yes stop_codon:yes gene_type:complete
MIQNSSINGRAAALTMLAAMMVIGCIDNFIALIARDAGLWQFQILRAAMGLPLVVLASVVGFGTLWALRLWAVALRSFFVAFAMLFYFGSLAFMPLAQALAGLFTSPIFILLITAFILREPVGPARIFAVIIGFIGILLVLDSDWATLTWTSFLPVFGGLFYAMGAVATRQLCEGESTLSMLSMLLIIQAIIGALALVVLGQFELTVPEGAAGFIQRGWVWPVTAALPFILLQAVGSVLGVGLIIRAYQLGSASYVAVYEYSVFISGPFFAWMLFGQTVTGVQTGGILLVAAAGIVIAWRSS